MTAVDRFNVQRFVAAQDAGATYDQALLELLSGRKMGHWMWYIFPQLPLGNTKTAQTYALSGRAEAAAYLAHPVLGTRLIECATALLSVESGRSALAIMGALDTMKLRSSATLFAAVSSPDSVFERLLARFYDGVADVKTLAMLASGDAEERQP